MENVEKTTWTHIHTCRLGREAIESSPVEKGLGMMLMKTGLQQKDLGSS